MDLLDINSEVEEYGDWRDDRNYFLFSFGL
jgi:hypothetical protein